MSTYNLNIDTVNTSLDYYQAEKHIYGSSRLGMLKDSVNVLGSAYGNTDSLNVTHKLGNKRYELSNHLGNVLTVISDKPIPHNNGGTVDYWEANISSAYDYSPFGVMLTGRTFEGKQTVCHDSTVQATQNALEEGFGSWGSWTAQGPGDITYVNDKIQVTNQTTFVRRLGVAKNFITGSGVHNVSFVVINNNCADLIGPPGSTQPSINVQIVDNLGNTVATGNYTTSGTFTFSFTPASVGMTYSIFFMVRATSLCYFELDEILISFEDTTTLTVCKEVEDGYRYGFNGMEVDKEVKGRGNSYTTEFRQYDPRIGRWLIIDPISCLFPWQSPYASFDNNPVFYKDPLGLAAEGTPKKTGQESEGQESGEYTFHCGNSEDEDNWALNFEEVEVTADRNAGKSSTANLEPNEGSHGFWWAQTIVGTAGTLMSPMETMGSWKATQQWSFTKKHVAPRLNMSTNKAFKKVVKPLIKLSTSWGKKIPVAGGILVIGDIMVNGKVEPSHILDATIVGVGTIPVFGWIVAGVYVISDVATFAITGQTIGEHLNEVDWSQFDSMDSFNPDHPVYDVMPTYSPGGKY